MRIVDAAVRLGVSDRTIKRWIRRGVLRTSRVPIQRHPFWRHEISLDALIDADDLRV